MWNVLEYDPITDRFEIVATFKLVSYANEYMQMMFEKHPKDDFMVEQANGE